MEKAIVLSDKSARLICGRKKKEIILDKSNTNYIGKPIFLCGDKVYGIIVLNEPTRIEKSQFKNRFKRHLITEEAADEMWPGEDTFYAYSFRIKRILRDQIVFNSESKKVRFIDNLEIEVEQKNEFTKGVIGFKDLGKAPVDESWSGPKERKKATVQDLRIMSTWFDNEKSDIKSSYKLPHHKAEGQHSAVLRGVFAAMAALLGARGGTNIPESDRRGVYNHLVKHYKQFDREPPIFKTYTDIELEEIFPEFFKADVIEEKIDFKKHYDELEKLQNEFIAKKGYDDLRVLILRLYKLLLNRMEIRKAEHGGGSGGGRTRCPAGMVRDRSTGRCIQRKTKCTEKDIKAGRCATGQIYRSEKYDNYYLNGFVKQIKIVQEGNFFRARLREPNTIVDGSFRTITLSEKRGIKTVIGRLKSDPNGPTHTQTVLFEKDKWTIASAREWVEEHRAELKSIRSLKSKDVNYAKK